MPPLNFLSYPTAAITVIISIIVFLLSLKLLSQWRTLGRKRKFHPIGGTMLNQLFNFSRLHHYMTDLARRYKTYRLIAPFRNEIYTADPGNVEYILKSNFLNYGKGMYNYMNLRDLLGEGIFAVDGEKWRQQRKVSSHEFSTKVLRDFSSVVFRKNASKVAIIVSEAAVSCQTFDIQDIFMKSTLDSIFKVAFGVELGTMCGSGSNNEGAEFSNAFDTASAMSLLRYAYPFWKLKKFLNVGSEARLKEAVNIVDTFVYKLNRNELETRNSEDYSPVKKDDILSRFLQEKGVDSDLKYLRDIILNFVIAGKDTTAATLAWFIYMMCKHPHIQERVAKEIEEQTRDHIHSTQKLTANPFDEFANCTTEEQLENMHYLHATLTETLRLYPAVPVDAKICFSDDTLPDGFSMKKGDMVSYLPYAMGRMTFLWGNDAEEFKPERWIDEKGTFRPESPFKFTAFQAGPRICLGKEFAYRQMKIFSAVLLPHFVFKLSDEEKPVNYRTMINLHIDGGLHVRAFCRSRT